MTEEKKKVRSSSKLIRYMKKVRDMYVRGMIAWSSNLSYADAAVGCPVGNLSTIPRSFSVNYNSATRSSGDNDFKDLIRASSASLKKSPRYGAELTAPTKIPRSRSVANRGVAFGRIDEDRPCEFGNDDSDMGKCLFYSRSRSYTVLRSEFDK